MLMLLSCLIIPLLTNDGVIYSSYLNGLNQNNTEKFAARNVLQSDINSLGYKPTSVSTEKYGGSAYYSLNVNGKTVKDLQNLYTSRWRVGLIEHWYDFSATSITTYTGVYAYFLQPQSKSTLLTGDVQRQLETHSTYYISKEQTIYFASESRYELEEEMYSSMNVSTSGLNNDSNMFVRNTMNLTFMNQFNYSRKQTILTEYSSVIKLDYNSAKYCPDDYSLTIGLCGKYSIVNFKVQERKNWWGSDRDERGPFDVKVLVINEASLSYNYVANSIDSPDTFYYLP